MSKQVKAEFAVTDADKFPLESCREKLARRYGLDAVCLSGPCEGGSLVDCVCDQMKSRWAAVRDKFAGKDFHARLERLAVSLAETLKKADNTGECVKDLVEQHKYEKTAAAEIAQYIKADVMPSRMDDVFAQYMQEAGGMGGAAPMGGMGMGGMSSGGPVEQQTAMGPGGMHMMGDSPLPGTDDGPLMDNGGGGMDDMIDMPLDGMGDMGPADGGAPPMGGDAGMPGGMDAGMGGMGGGDTVSLELPMDLVQELDKALDSAMGQAGGMGGIGDMGGGDAGPIDISDDDDDGAIIEVGDDDDETPGEPSDEQKPGEQFVTGDDEDKGKDKGGDDKGDKKPDSGGGDNPFAKKDDGGDKDTDKEAAMALRAGHLKRIGQTVLKLGPEMSINNTDQLLHMEGKELGDAKEKEVAKPKALDDGNVKPEGHTAGGNKFQDGKTMGAEEKFDAKKVSESDVSSMSSSLMGKEKAPDFAKPSVPAGGGRIGNEPEISVNLETKGTVIATIDGQGVLIKTPDGKEYRARRDISAKWTLKDYQQKLGGLLSEIKFDGSGEKFAKAAHRAMKLADTSFNTDGVTKIDTGKKEGSEFTNDADKKPEGDTNVGTAKGGASDNSAKSGDGIKTYDAGKKEDANFTNDAEKKPEGDAKAAAEGKSVKVADNVDPNKEKVVKDHAGDKKIGDKKPMDEQIEVEGHTAGGNKYQDGKTMGAEEKFDAKKVSESDVSSMGSSLMGKEKDPGFETPKVPAGGPNPEENYKPEGDVKIKGTVIADQAQKREAEEAIAKVANDAKLQLARVKAASAYCADLLLNGEITAAQYADELEKYAALPVQAIQSLASSTRKARERVAARAGMTTEAKTAAPAGLGVPIVQASSIIQTTSGNANSELTKKLEGLFTWNRNEKRLREFDAEK